MDKINRYLDFIYKMDAIVDRAKHNKKPLDFDNFDMNAFIQNYETKKYMDAKKNLFVDCFKNIKSVHNKFKSIFDFDGFDFDGLLL